LSVSQPPSAGPRIGPTVTPTPHIAIAEPCFSRGQVSSRTACDSGTSAAPNTPWSSRNSTISVSEPASPHSTEAAVKPTTEARNRRLRPNRAASQPVGGVMIAAATMYEVSTQLIWSWLAETLPCM